MRFGIDAGVLREKARGVGHYLLNILNQFAKINKTDEFFLYSPKPILYNFNHTGKWHIRNGTLSLPGTFWLQTQAKSFIKKDKIDTFFAPAHILPLGLPNNIRKVLTVHDLVSIIYPKTMANYNRFVHKLFFEPSVRRADHIITMSEATKKSLINYFGINESKITVIYEGVSERFRPYEKNLVLSVLERYKIERPYILSVGTLEPRKNYPVLLQVFKHLKADYDLVIIGKRGWKAREIFSLINQWQLATRIKIKILGYVDEEDLPFLYNGATVFVFPSIYEGFGLPVLEALACGVPVVCSNSSSLPEVGGDAVLYFEPSSVDDLIMKIQKILQDNQLRKSLKEKGIIQARKFNWETTAQKTLGVLRGK